MKRVREDGLWQLFTCCWLTYLTTYLCRVNFSRAMTAINRDIGISVESLGTAGALFFLIYACGQLINGFLGDRVRPVRFLILALAGTAVCNAGVGLCKSFTPLLILWGANGYFQSIFWSTIVRLLALRIAPEKRSSISFGITSAMPAAYLMSWCVLGNLFAKGSSSLYFLVPAGVAAVMIIVWAIYGRHMGSETREAIAPDQHRLALSDSIRLILRKRLWLLMPLCVMHGVIKEGVGFWAPKLLEDRFAMDSALGVLSIALLPLANLAGMLWGKRLLHKNPLAALLSMFVVIALAALALSIGSAGMLGVALMALVSGLSFGNNMVLMSFIPMQYARDGIVATLAGLYDFSSYIGAAISTYALGRVLGALGFAPLPYIWAGAAALAIGVDLLARKRFGAGEDKINAQGGEKLSA